MRTLFKMLLSTAALVPVVAHAEDDTGFYGSLTVGAASVSDVNTTFFAPGGYYYYGGEGSYSAASVPTGSDTVAGKFDVKPAFAIGGSLGYDFGLVRTDVEVSYARSKLRSFTVTGGSSGGTAATAGEAFDAFCYDNDLDCPTSGTTVSVAGSSKLRQLNAMANVWVDIPTGMPIEPYIGGGLGVSGFELEGEGKTRFAWQVGGGAAYKINPHFALTADLRYREAKGATIYDDTDFGYVIGKIKTFSYGVGLRATF